MMTAKNRKWAARARQITTKLINKYNICTDLKTLWNQVNDATMREQSITSLENINAHLHEAMIGGATAYKAHHNTWWSPEIHHAYLTEKFWKLKKIQGGTLIRNQNQ